MNGILWMKISSKFALGGMRPWNVYNQGTCFQDGPIDGDGIYSFVPMGNGPLEICYFIMAR